MAEIKCISKKDISSIIKKGDTITIVTTLYKKDTLLVKAINGVFNKEGKLVRYFSKIDLLLDLKKEGLTIEEISPPVYSPKGSYKSSVIKLENGETYPSSLVRSYQDSFEKI